MGSLSLFQGILPTQGSNSGLPHRRQVLYQLSYKGSPRILEWVAYPSSRGYLPDPGIKPGSPALQADSLPTELLGKPSHAQTLTQAPHPNYHPTPDQPLFPDYSSHLKTNLGFSPSLHQKSHYVTNNPLNALLVLYVWYHYFP